MAPNDVKSWLKQRLFGVKLTESGADRVQGRRRRDRGDKQRTAGVEHIYEEIRVGMAEDVRIRVEMQEKRDRRRRSLEPQSAVQSLHIATKPTVFKPIDATSRPALPPPPPPPLPSRSTHLEECGSSASSYSSGYNSSQSSHHDVLSSHARLNARVQLLSQEATQDRCTSSGHHYVPAGHPAATSHHLARQETAPGDDDVYDECDIEVASIFSDTLVSATPEVTPQEIIVRRRRVSVCTASAGGPFVPTENHNMANNRPRPAEHRNSLQNNTSQVLSDQYIRRSTNTHQVKYTQPGRPAYNSWNGPTASQAVNYTCHLKFGRHVEQLRIQHQGVSAIQRSAVWPLHSSPGRRSPGYEAFVAGLSQPQTQQIPHQTQPVAQQSTHSQSSYRLQRSADQNYQTQNLQRSQHPQPLRDLQPSHRLTTQQRYPMTRQLQYSTQHSYQLQQHPTYQPSSQYRPEPCLVRKCALGSRPIVNRIAVV